MSERTTSFLQIVQSTLMYLSSSILSELEKCFDTLLKEFNGDRNTITDAFNDARIVHSKLKTTIQVLPYAMIFDKVSTASHLTSPDPKTLKLTHSERSILTEL